MRRILALLLLLLPSCSKTAETQDVTVAKQKIWDAVKKYYQANDQGDLETMEKLLAPNCSAIWGGEAVRGKPQVTEKLKISAAQVKGNAGKRSTLVGNEVVDVTRDSAVVTFEASMTGTGAAYAAAVSMFFRRLDNEWLIEHIHESWTKK